MNANHLTAIRAITDPRRTDNMEPPLGNVQMNAICIYIKAVAALPPAERTAEIVKLLDCWGQRYKADTESPRLPYGIKTIINLAGDAVKEMEAADV